MDTMDTTCDYPGCDRTDTHTDPGARTSTVVVQPVVVQHRKVPTMLRLNSRSPEVAQFIRDRVPFRTHGSLSADTRTYSTGYLRGDDLDRYYADLPTIDYVVVSYSTPIAWHTSDGRWYKVKQRFSTTTSRHQGRLYLIPDLSNEESTIGGVPR